MQYADAPAVRAGSPPEQKSFRVLWLPPSHRTVGMRAVRGKELDGKKRSDCSVPFLQRSQASSDLCFVFVFYLQPFHKRRQQCPLPCHRAAVERLPHIAPCTHLSAAEFDSHMLSTSLLLAPSQKRPRTEPQNHTGPEFDSEQRQNNIVSLNIKMLLHWHYRKIKVQT